MLPYFLYVAWLLVTGQAFVSLTRFPCPRCNKPYFGKYDNIMAKCCENCLQPLPRLKDESRSVG